MDTAQYKQRAETYLGENFTENVKEIFRFTGDLIAKGFSPGFPAALLDVGCATGDLLCYLATLFPQARIAGIDTQEEFVRAAMQRKILASSTITVDDALAFRHENGYECIVNIGVLPVFEECEPFLANLIRNTRPGGRIYIGSMFNDDDIDVRVAYRDNNYSEEWQRGQNIFSTHSIARFLADRVQSYTFHPFELPFDIPKNQTYPHRGHTLCLASGKRQVISGLCLLYYEKILEIIV